MAAGDVLVQNTIGPRGAEPFATARAFEILGGFKSVADATARDAIPSQRREEGMLVRTNDNGKLWTLGSDLVTWAELPVGSGASQYKAVADVAARDAIPSGERSEGMIVRTNDDGQLYVLDADLTTWRYWEPAPPDASPWLSGTLDTLHFYADPATGTPDADGLTPATAVDDPQRILGRIPDNWNVRAIIHVAAGTFSNVVLWTLLAQPSIRSDGSAASITILGDHSSPDAAWTTTSTSPLIPGTGNHYSLAVPGGWTATVDDTSHWLYFVQSSGDVSPSSAKPIASTSPSLTVIGGLTVGYDVELVPWSTIFTGIARIFAPDAVSTALRIVGIKFTRFSTARNASFVQSNLENTAGTWTTTDCTIYTSREKCSSSSISSSATRHGGAAQRNNLLESNVRCYGIHNTMDGHTVRGMLGVGEDLGNMRPIAGAVFLVGMDFEGAGKLWVGRDSWATFQGTGGQFVFNTTGAPFRFYKCSVYGTSGPVFTGQSVGPGVIAEGAWVSGIAIGIVDTLTGVAQINIGTGGVRDSNSGAYSDPIDFSRYLPSGASAIYDVGTHGVYTCGSSVAVGDAVYVDASSVAQQAIATDESTLAVGMVAKKLTSTRALVIYKGEIAIAGLTARKNYFLSGSTPGGRTTDATTLVGKFAQRLGYSRTTGIFVADVSRDYTLL